MMEYSVKKMQGSGYILQVDDKPMVCPFIMALPAVDKLNRPHAQLQPCSSQCACFEVHKNNTQVPTLPALPLPTPIIKPLAPDISFVNVHLHCCKRTFTDIQEKK